MQLGDLTTLSAVKNWIGSEKFSGTGNADTILASLISRKSRDVCAYLERPYILPQVYSDQYDGKGSRNQFIKNWPITSISSLSVDGIIIPYSPSIVGQSPTLYGYRFDPWNGLPPGSPQAVSLMGYTFCRGTQNVLVSYTAGYQVIGEVHTIPASSSPSITVNQVHGNWATDQGVTDNGLVPVSFTPVLVAPTIANTYQVVQPDTGTPPAAPGTYNFASADAGRTVLISYGFVPLALEQIVIELTAERYLYRGHIGEHSRTVGQQVTTKYDTSEVPRYAMPTLQRFKSVLPL